MRTNLISVGVCAKVGKDTLYKIFKEEIESKYPDYKVVKLSIGDLIREECNKFTIHEFGIDLFKCNPEEKENFRPLMVWWGEIRKIYNKNYWCEILEYRIKSSEKSKIIYFHTDLRYSEEADWVQKRGGKIIHLSRWYMKNGYAWTVEPSNESEGKYNEIIKQRADYRFEWSTTDNLEERKKFAQLFIDWFLEE